MEVLLTLLQCLGYGALAVAAIVLTPVLALGVTALGITLVALPFAGMCWLVDKVTSWNG